MLCNLHDRYEMHCYFHNHQNNITIYITNILNIHRNGTYYIRKKYINNKLCFGTGEMIREDTHVSVGMGFAPAHDMFTLFSVETDTVTLRY